MIPCLSRDNFVVNPFDPPFPKLSSALACPSHLLAWADDLEEQGPVAQAKPMPIQQYRQMKRWNLDEHACQQQHEKRVDEVTVNATWDVLGSTDSDTCYFGFHEHLHT